MVNTNLWAATLLLGPFALGSCARHHAISGTVIDRNGQPVERVVVSLDPGGVETLTGPDGVFMVDYLRDEDGERVRLARRTLYEVELFRTGFHISKHQVDFKRGELILEPFTLAEDTIHVPVGVDNIDPALFPDRSQSTGATYEGE
jgi:hypothetical protein